MARIAVCRTAFLEAKGFQVMQLWNHQLPSEVDSVLPTIFVKQTEMAASPPASGRGTS